MKGLIGARESERENPTEEEKEVHKITTKKSTRKKCMLVYINVILQFFTS